MDGMWWHQIGQTVFEEFNDLSELAQITQVVVRLLVAAALGGLLGFERESQGKSAGIRTHMLVSLGAALFVLIPQQAGLSKADISRVVQGLVAGIGFLGAGTIIKGETTHDVKGLTTAAGIWLTAAVGVCAGIGRESTAILSTLLALAILFATPHFSMWLFRRKN
jgi:putative Mg2+ transporter-C (MgtC) family protein